MSLEEKALTYAIRAALCAGEEIERLADLPHVVKSKGSSRDLVSVADDAAEQAALRVLTGSDLPAGILSEESGYLGNGSQEYLWTVDPLDGTVNFVHGIPMFTVSIALLKEGVPIIGVIYCPGFKDLYFASKDSGAFKNDRVLAVTSRPLGESLFGVSFSGTPTRASERNSEYELFGRINDVSRGCLRTGSAALNLAYLAEGRFNGCWGHQAKVWDISAGLLIAQEAGALLKTEVVSEDSLSLDYWALTNQNKDAFFSTVAL